jgi:hypothetical protein
MTAHRLVSAADHGGPQLKTEPASWLQAREYYVLGLGASYFDSYRLSELYCGSVRHSGR